MRAFHYLTRNTEQMGGRLPAKLMVRILLAQEDQRAFKNEEYRLP